MSAVAMWLKWLAVAAVVTVVALLVMFVFGPVAFTVVIVAGSLYGAPLFVRAMAKTFPGHFPRKYGGTLPLAFLLLAVGAASPGEAEAAVYPGQAEAVCIVGADGIPQDCPILELSDSRGVPTSTIS